MQLLATADQMKQFDRTAIRKYSIPGLLLMENAGRAFVDELEKHAGPLGMKNVTIICGKGNNGGDGFVIARHLINRGSAVSVFLLCKRHEVKGDAKTNLGILLNIASRKKNSVLVKEIGSIRSLVRESNHDIIVDAVFGTGFAGRVKGLHLRVIDWINTRGKFVASVDIPSGTNATTGVIENKAVKANLTVSMGLAKIGHYVGKGGEHAGRVEVVDISIPSFVYRPARAQVYRVLPSDIRDILPKRSRTAHKYSVGKVFVLAGSRGLTGAPFMCVQAAMKAGAGAVILGVPKSIHTVLARKVTEVMVTPLEETREGTLAATAIDVIREKVEWADVVVLGPGLSRNPETRKLVVALISETMKPLVIDADGLNALASDISVLRRRKQDTILTPHVGELSSLIGARGKEIELLRVETAAKSAQRLQCIIALKGAPTVTATPEGEAYVNSTGNPGMATAGSGDVLTGVIAGLLAQGMPAEKAAYSGVLLHGMAGDIAAEKLGERSLLALDILEYVPQTFKVLAGL
jgi:ADP-dependent NAD(P)H-hydrate dehydratase / NAD(P)H-hydrate epimerase